MLKLSNIGMVNIFNGKMKSIQKQPKSSKTVQNAQNLTMHLLGSLAIHLPSIKKIRSTVLKLFGGYTDRLRFLAL